MAIPTLDSSAVSVAGTGTSLAVPFPGTVNSGDFLLLTYGVSSATGASLPGGWTLKKTASQDDCTAELYTKIASGSETGNLTFTVGEDGLPKIARMYRSEVADDLEAIDSSSATGKVLNHPAIVTTSTDRLGMTLTAINDNETAASFTGESNGDLTLLADDLTALGTDHALSVQTADLASAVTLSGGTWSFSGANEDWVTLGWAIFKTVALTQKSISVTFTTAMANTHFKIGVVSAAVGFVTTMARTQKLDAFRTFNVAFGTAMSTIRKTTPVAKTVAFITTMASTVIPTHVQLINVTFDVAMSIVSKVIKASRAFALGTAFTLTKKVSVLKAVSFSTSMSLAASLLVFRSFSVSFVTTMALSMRKTFTRTISVSFATAMSLATRFISAAGGGVFGAWAFIRRRRGKRWR